MKQTQEFIFDSFKIQTDRKTINFRYKVGKLVFDEKIILPREIPTSVSQDLLNRVLQSLHLMLGISYFKMFCPKKIIIPYSLTKEQANFWNNVYTKGLGEFFYRNQIDFRSLINFPYVDRPSIQPRRPACRQAGWDEAKKDRFLVGIGGGKDSIVTVEMLKKENKEITGYILETQADLPLVQKEVIKAMGINCLIVKRQLDKKIFELESKKIVYKGHIPITAVYSFVGLLLATVYDYSFIVVSNEKSANFGNVNYLGLEINHQWSKSIEFEKLFQDYIHRFITDDINYSSILRQYSELQIAEKFTQYPQYFSVFSSCNKNFRILGFNQKKWCGDCPKCAFNFIIFAANLAKEEVVGIFHKNLLNDPKLIPLYQDLIGKGKMKPFDCVGTFEETKKAFELVAKKGDYKDDYIIKNL